MNWGRIFAIFWSKMCVVLIFKSPSTVIFIRIHVCNGIFTWDCKMSHFISHMVISMLSTLDMLRFMLRHQLLFLYSKIYKLCFYSNRRKKCQIQLSNDGFNKWEVFDYFFIIQDLYLTCVQVILEYNSGFDFKENFGHVLDLYNVL